MLYLLAAKLDPDTKLSTLTRKQMRDHVGGKPADLSTAIKSLLYAELVAYGPRPHTYWLSPRAFLPVSILTTS
ncbi:hypothetical protein [Spirosoma sordidisoli]|uniref:Uncharacterized protein n=1 Tax=Spirosoma sordidisoli TaxID=2502893 RepID=A0A4Q2UMT0_9BACT|nr:hypothetical protein [Spirosoma sordidisoli]RYC70704.1 hypothetical protein EQG79_00700 [Spirosoma sordidisoli]